MKEIIKDKIKDLEQDYDYWLEIYDRDGLEYQEKKLNIIRAQISVLNEILERGDNYEKSLLYNRSK